MRLLTPKFDSYGIFQGAYSVSMNPCHRLMRRTEYYTSHPPFNTSSGVTIAAVGTIALALQYGEVCVPDVSILMISKLNTFYQQAFLLSLLLARYPDFLRASMWSGLALYFSALFASSFATQVP